MASENAITASPTTTDSPLDERRTDSVPSESPAAGPIGTDPAGPWLLGLLALLAVLTALVPIRNSDFFQHLALGRFVCQGHLPLGTDPLTAPGEVVPFAQHSWVFDVVLFLLYSLSGVLGVMLLKVGLVILMLHQQLRVALVPGTRAAVSVVCLTLGLIVLAPYLLVNSRLASLALLAVTVATLTRYHIGAKNVPPFWTLPALCALWGNLDGWFVLGPLCIGLYFVGLILEEHRQPAPAEGATSQRVPAPLPAIFGACLLAVCLNPGLAALGWSLPVELGFNRSLAVVGTLPGYQHLGASPLSEAYFLPTTGWTVAGQGYFVLLLLVPASFLLLGRQVSLAGLLLVAGLAGLSLYRVAAIPFFAVAAAPWLARNVQLLLAATPQPEDGKKADATSGSLLAVLLVLLTGVGAYAGWLGPWPWTQSRFGIGLETDAGLKEMAEKTLTLNDWYREKTGEPIPVWLNTSPEAAHYIAWFAPGQRSYLDQRLALSPQGAQAYREINEAPFRRLRSKGGEADPYAPLRERRVHFVAFHHPELMLALQGIRKLSSAPTVEEQVMVMPLALPLYQLLQIGADWNVLHIRGATSLFGFRDPADGAKWARFYDDRTVRPVVLAFGEQPLRAPDQGPTQEPEPRAWLTTLWNPEPLRNLDAEETAQYRLLYESSLLPQQHIVALRWEAYRAMNFLLAATSSSYLPGPARAATASMVVSLLNPDGKQNPDPAVRYPQHYFRDKDIGSPSALYSMLRKARCSLEANPSDAQVQARLAQSYFLLSRQTRENFRSEAFPPLRQLRRYQIIAAAQTAQRLNPDLEGAHQMLVEAYSDKEVGAFDLMVYHYKEYVRLNIAGGPQGGEKIEDARKRWAGLAKTVSDLEKELTNRSSRWTLQTANKKKIQRAVAALLPGPDGQLYGVPQEGVRILQELTSEELMESLDGRTPGPGPRLLIEGLFLTGNIPALRANLEGADPRVFGMHPELGIPALDWYRFCLGACTGDYEKANLAIQSIVALLEKDTTAAGNRAQSARLFTEFIASPFSFGTATLAPQQWLFQPPLPLQDRLYLSRVLAEASREPAALEANLRVLQAGILLEWGDIPAARTALEKAREAAARIDRSHSALGMAQLYEEMLERGREASR